MPQTFAPAGASAQAIRIRIIRADGRVEDRGLVSYWHKNPILNLVVNAYICAKNLYWRWRTRSN